jgi:hypothetical protein
MYPSADGRVPLLPAVGIGLRAVHYGELAQRGLSGVSCAEAVTENFLDRGGRPLGVLERVRRDVPVFLHGVALSLGGVDALDLTYLRRLRDLCARVEPALVSDHACFGAVAGRHAHDLLPLPYTEETIGHLSSRIGFVQDLLGRRILLENVSSYVSFRASTMPEWELLSEVTRRSGCGLLLDVNNVIVSAFNHGFDPDSFIDGLPVGAVLQLHVAGHTDHGTYKLDDHGSAVSEAVWALYRRARVRFGAHVPAIVEWDQNIPELPRLVAEAERAAAIDRELGALAPPRASGVPPRSAA